MTEVTAKNRKIRLVSAFGQHSVEGLDSNGVWVAIDPGQCHFSNRAEAEDYIAQWLDLNEDMERVDDIGE